MRVLSVLLVLLAAGLALFLWLTPAPSPPPVSVGTDAGTPAASEGLATGGTLTKPEAPETELGATRQAQDVQRADVAASTAAGPSCRILGRIVDENGGALEGVAVSMYSVGGPWSTVAKLPLVGEPGKQREVLETKSAADGRFELAAPLPTSDWVSLSLTPGDYFALGGRDFGPAGGRNQPRLVEGDNDLGDFVLARRGAVAGSVRSADGASLEGANVSSLADPNSGRVSNARVDASNHFLLGHVPPGSITLGVKAEGWISAQKIHAEVRANETTTIAEIVLARASEISGVVVDQDGKPAPKVRVWGWPQSSGQGAGATSREDGTFTIYLPQTEPYTLEVKRAKEFEPWGGKRGAAEFTFEPGRKDVRIVLQRAAQITFRVVDAATGTPIESFGIAVEEKLPPGTTRSRDDRGLGSAAHPGGAAVLPASIASHDVTVRAQGYAPYGGPIVLDAGSQDTATVALERSPVLRGRLVRAGAPVPDASVTLQRESLLPDGKPYERIGSSGTNIHFDVGEFAGRVRNQTTGADGRFEYDELVAGTYALTVQGRDLGKRSWRALAVPKEGALDLGDVALDAGAIVRGQLLAPVGGSPVGYSVRLDGFDRELVIARADGSFEFAGLEPGKHLLDWSRPKKPDSGFTRSSAHATELVLAAGEVRDVAINTAEFAPCSVRARVLRNGQPASGVRVRAEIHRTGNERERDLTDDAKLDGAGWAVLEVEGRAHFDLAVVGSAGNNVLARLADLEAVAGATIERTLELHLGTLLLEVPLALATPEPNWMLQVVLAGAGQEKGYASAGPPGSKLLMQGARPWTGQHVHLGEFPAGTYQATVAFERFEDDPQTPGRRKRVPLRDPFETTVTIEDGRSALIVVP